MQKMPPIRRNPLLCGARINAPTAISKPTKYNGVSIGWPMTVYGPLNVIPKASNVSPIFFSIRTSSPPAADVS